MDEDKRKNFRVINNTEANDQGKPAKRFRPISAARLLPSLLTLLAMYLGFTSISFAMQGKFEFVIGLIVIAAFLDAIDGRVARFMKSDSRFGAELDSLADFLNFGLVPALTLWMWQLNTLGNVGLVLAFFFSVCCALRLARFNAALDDSESDDKGFFSGVPAPGGGLLVLIPIVLTFLGVDSEIIIKPLTIIFVICVGLLMVSKLPTYSPKKIRLRLPRHNFVPILLLTAVTGVMIFNFPFVAFLVCGLIYLASIPMSVLAQHRKNGTYF